MVKTLTRREDLQETARKILGGLHRKKDKATLVTLSGELGAGKTTFVQTLAKELGVKEVVQSPTYVLMKRYDTAHPEFRTLVHVDLYRLKGPEELGALRLEDVFKDQDTIVAIEWPERAEETLPTPDSALKFSSDGAGEGERYIESI